LNSTKKKNLSILRRKLTFILLNSFLYIALLFKSEKIAEFLMDKGASISWRRDDKMTPLVKSIFLNIILNMSV
jgi:hypothetical protein